ncbi:MAG TPA: hypothetical protein VFP49_10935 [Nitrososphaeraceae archaeon]|nr:hypothetical protein [Nitrososphaeraceae archaeon]
MYNNNYLEELLRYKLEEKKAFCCEVCSVQKLTVRRAATAITVNEFHKDGTVKIHYTCSNHIVDLYNKIIKEIESK